MHQCLYLYFTLCWKLSAKFEGRIRIITRIRIRNTEETSDIDLNKIKARVKPYRN